MERLTEKIGNTNCVKDCGSNCKYGFQHCRTEDWENCKTIDDIIDKLAEYEDLEERLNGVSVKEIVNGFIKTVESQTNEEYKHGRILTNTEADKWNEYKRLEEQGLLLRLPCKMGDTLYQPISNQINEYKVIGLCFDITRNEFMYEVAYQIGLQWYKATCDFDCINKTVFFTKSEAEQKLKEMESD